MSPPVWPKTGNLMNLAVDLSLYYSSRAICSVLAPYLLIIKGIITSWKICFFHCIRLPFGGLKNLYIVLWYVNYLWSKYFYIVVKGVLFSESAMCLSDLQNISLSWPWNLNFLPITVYNIFKIQFQHSDLKYFLLVIWKTHLTFWKKSYLGPSMKVLL